MSRKLVAYFSASGTTAKVAETLAEAIGADIYEIEPAAPYSKADLDWTNQKSRSSIEMSDPAYRPAIAGKRDNMDDYDIVFVGFPIWWYVAPHIINTFLESYDLTGKTIIPFATSGGSGMGKTNEKLQPSCPNSKLIEGSISPSEQKVRSVSLVLRPSVRITPRNGSRNAFRDAIPASARRRSPTKVSRLSSTFRTASKLRKARDMNTGRRSTISKKPRKRSTILLKTISCNMQTLKRKKRTFTSPMPVPVKS